jgi:O-antigen ligase
VGLVGAFAFVALFLLQAKRAWTALREGSGPRRQRLLLGAFATLVALLVVSLAGPHLNGDSSTPYLAAVIALIELVPLLPEERGGTPTRLDPDWELWPA